MRLSLLWLDRKNIFNHFVKCMEYLFGYSMQVVCITYW